MILIRLLTPVLFLIALSAAPATAASFSHVVIDPGHGGHDRGGFNGLVFEKHLALDVSFRLEQFLKRHGVKSQLTRSRDEFISLDARPAKSNGVRNAIFVSIHFNAASREGAAGIETFYHKSDSYALAAVVQRHILQATGADTRGVKHANFRVLRKSSRPAILVECGFLTNASERRLCLDPRYRQRLAEGIGRGILDYR
ncbi:hypothetical protein BH23VER1_BH23VER1_35680 [soil metagenome]